MILSSHKHKSEAESSNDKICLIQNIMALKVVAC
jgi:hypothetical protein